MPLRIRAAKSTEVGTILQLVRGLADYENLSHEVTASEERLQAALFPTNGKPIVECLLAWEGSDPAGFAVFFTNFSTFLALPGIYLEDLYVRPDKRGRGIGKKLISRVARIACKRGCGRLEWSVLAWNKPAIRFYESIGAKHRPDWNLCRLEGPALSRFA
ncbi:MAG: GNAT family N-acetyltransferase [Opitutaceae bacterium]|jgi:GNAT superfamily N-acetyltransferase